MYWKIALILGVFLIIDIVGHLCFKIKRNILEWLLISALILCTTGSLTIGIMNHFEKSSNDGSAIFMSYKYLMDGDVEQCRLKLSETKGSFMDEAEIMEVFADVMSGDYIQGYFKTERLLNESTLSSASRKYLKEIQKICEEKLGLTDSESVEQLESYDEYLENLSANDSLNMTVNSLKVDEEDEISSLLKKFMNSLGFTKREINKYTEEYELDKKLYATDISEISLEDIKEIRAEYGNSEDVMRLQCKYYVSNKDYDSAKKVAAKLVDEYRNEENYVIYTDIIAQEAYDRENASSYENSEELYDMKDSEVRELVNEANNKKNQAEKLQEKYSDIDEETQDKIDKLIYEAEELYKKANYISVERAINYIISKKPSKGDSTGMYDLQLAKLYLIIGDRDTAHKYLYEVIDNSVDISEDSDIKDELDEVVSQYNQISGDEYNAELNNAIDELIEKHSNGVVPSNDSSINGAFDSYVTNSLKYDKINIHISRIDTEDYPNIKAYININGDKEGNSELASDFEEEDFDLIDTQYEIEDFKILKDDESNQVSIGIVMDRSGSMDGSPIENAKMAAIEAVNNMDTETQKISIISYSDSSTVEQTLSNKKETLKRVINGINSYGGTYISKGLVAGINEIKDEKGSRAIILMSDGQDGGSAEEMQNAVDLAVEEGICVYTVAFGECDDVYMKSIADATGGKFIKASDSAELSDIYLTLQKYIVNNYCIEYEITKNEETDPRYLTVNISKYNTSSTKEYYLNEENKPEDSEGDNDFIEKIDENTLGIASVKANSVSVQDVDKGMEITITGGGFEEDVIVTIGGLPLSNITVQDKTTLTGTLKGKLEVGEYDVQVKTSDGRLAIGNKMFYVFKSGTTSSVKLGCTTITADTIGQIDDNTLVASGNVMINGFIHSAGDMEITVDNMDENISLKSNTTTYVGDSGKLEGESKLYISYEQQKKNNGSFTDLVMGGKDYVIQKNSYCTKVTISGADFDREITDFDLKIPFIMDIDVAEVNLYYNRLQIDIKSFNLNEIVENVDKSIKHEKGLNEPEPKIIKRGEVNKFDITNAGDLALSMAITPDGIQFGGEAKLNVNDAISFSNFGINEVSVKLNSLDKDNQYWKIGGKIDFSKSIPGFAGSGIAGFESYLSSYYWLPDKVELKAELNPGIPVYKIIEINEVGGSLQGMSTGILKAYEALVKPETYEILGTGIDSDSYDYQDVILQADVGAEANIFNAVNMNKLFQKFKEWGEIGEIDGSVAINFSEPELKIAAEMCLLGSEKAEAEATIGKSGLDVKAAVELEISGFGMKIKGGADANVGGNLTGAYLGAGINGELKCSPLDINYKGAASFKVEFDWDFDKASVTINYKDGADDKEGTLWYDEDGGLFIWDRISVTTN